MAAGTEKLPDIFRLRNKAREDLKRVLNAVKSIRDLSKIQPTARRNRIFLVLLFQGGVARPFIFSYCQFHLQHSLGYPNLVCLIQYMACVTNDEQACVYHVSQHFKSFFDLLIYDVQHLTRLC